MKPINCSIQKWFPVILTACLVFPINTRAQDSVQNLIERGNELFNDGDFEGAVESYGKALEIKPDDSVTLTGFGLALLEKEKLLEAVSYLEKALKLDPENDIARINLAHAQCDLNRYDDAVKNYRKAIEADPNNYALHFYTGLALYRNTEYNDAIESCLQVLELHNDMPEAYNIIGHSYIGKSDTAKAVEYFNRALTVDPNNFNAHLNLAHIYEWLKDYDAAFEKYTQALEINPEHIRTYLEFGMMLKSTGNKDGAVYCFKKALEVDPKYLPAKTALLQSGKFKLKPRLTANARFVDFYGETVLYGGERGAIHIKIMNMGEGKADSIKAVVTPLTPINGITVEPVATISMIPSGKSYILKIPLIASKDVTDGEVRFRIYLKEEWGFDLDPPLEITIKTGAP